MDILVICDVPNMSNLSGNGIDIHCIDALNELHVNLDRSLKGINNRRIANVLILWVGTTKKRFANVMRGKWCDSR